MTMDDIDILDVIGRDTQLKQVARVAGRGPELAGPCPFCGGHDRLRVQPAMQQWWCRQCSPSERWQSAADYVMRRDNVSFAVACRTLGIAPREQERPGWDYHDADGTVIYRVERYIKDGQKHYVQRTPDAAGGWQSGLRGVSPTIYRLPEVLRAAANGDVIYIAEGEKCADAIRRLGLTATTNSGGAGKWRVGFAAHLRGASDVVILEDNDAAGRKHATAVLSSVRGIVPSARVVSFRELPDGGDVADWIASGHTREDLEQRCAPPAPQTTEYVVSDWRQHITTAAELYNREFAPLQWIVSGILPEGATLLAGKPKSRKSWFALGLSCMVASRQRALGRLDVKPGRVLYLDLESNQRRAKERIKSILGDRMASVTNLHIVNSWPRGADGIAALEQWMIEYPDTVLVVIDVLADFRRGRDPKEDAYLYDRETLQPINEFAERHHIAVLALHHTRKAKSDDVFDEISGSTGLVSAVANILMLGRAPNGQDGIVLDMRGRDLINDEPLALEWDDYASQHQIVGGASSVQLSQERKAIIDAMSDDNSWSPRDIAATISKSVSSVQAMLKVLLSEGLIEKTGHGKYGLIRTKPKTTITLTQNTQNSQNAKNAQNTQNGREISLSSVSHSEDALSHAGSDSEVILSDSEPILSAELRIDSALGRAKVTHSEHSEHSEYDSSAQDAVDVFAAIPEDVRDLAIAFFRSDDPADVVWAHQYCETYVIDYDQARSQARKEAL